MASQHPSRKPAAFLLSFFMILICTGLAYASDLSGSGVLGSIQQQPVTEATSKGKNSAVPLELSKAVERKIAGGDTHLYSVVLAAGQFMHVVVIQRGVDLVAFLSDPTGREVLKVDYQNGTHGPQSVSYVAETPGVYVLKVKKLIKNSLNGPYEIKLTELREATAQDRRRAAADRALIEGSLLIEKGDRHSLEEALNKFSAAHEFFKDYDDTYQDAMSLYMSGLAVSLSGDVEGALSFYGQALPLFGVAEDRAGQGQTLNEMGGAYFGQGKNDQALEALGKALELYRSVGDQADEILSLTDIGQLHFSMGDKKKALEYYKQALPICEKVKYDTRHASVLVHLAQAYVSSGDPTLALRTDESALLYYTKAKDQRGIAFALDRIGWIYYVLGEGEKALENYNRSLMLSRKSGDRNAESATLNNIGWVHFLLGEKRAAINQLTEALSITREVKSRRNEAGILKNIMAVWKALDNPNAAIFYGKQAVNIYQEIRSQSQELDKGLQKSFLNSNENVYRTLAELLVSAGRFGEAQQILDMLKEDEYFQYLRRQSKGVFTRAAITNKEAILGESTSASSDQVTAIGRAINELLAKGELTAEEKRRLAQLKAQRDVEQKIFQKTLEEIRKTPENSLSGSNRGALADVLNSESMMSTLRDLGHGTVALYTIQGEAKYTVILYTQDTAVARDYKIKAADLNQKIMAFRQVLQDPTKDPRPLAQELYKILVGPVASNLKAIKAKTLMWAFDGMLRYVPVAALHDGEKYMVEQYQNVVFTPASYARLKDRGDARKWRVLGLGVTKAVGNYPALPGVKEELDGIIRRDGDTESKTGVMPGVILLDDNFTEGEMEQALQNKFQVVHIASHFDFEPGNNRKSLLLLGDGKYLPVSDISESLNLFDGVELLTLSACNTAMGESDAAGAELENFAVLAQNQGAKSVTATLWSVADSSTSLLMRKFYQLLDDNSWMPKAEALRLAQLSLLNGQDAAKTSFGESQRSDIVGTKKQNTTTAGRFNVDPRALYAHPYFWAPFILIGNWQ
jgi:CHAT domain-containing protein/Tfp pilus assembly protein PilF